MSSNTAENNANDGQWIDFNTLLSSSTRALSSNSADIQLKALNILFSLANNADENMRSEMGSTNLIAELTKIVAGHLAQEGLTVGIEAQMRLYATLAMWSLCMGHAENKKRCGGAIRFVVPQLPTFEDENEALFDAKKALYKYSAMFLWSVSYGIIENKQKVVEAGGVEKLANLLKHKLADFDTMHAAAGALWHLCEISHTCNVLTADEAALRALVKTATQSGVAPNQIIVGCLALSSLANFSELSATQIKKARGFEALSRFTRQNDATKYESSFVWTTVKPLMDLLTSKYPEVVELGCFLSYTVCGKTDIPKLFNEGVVDSLKGIVARGRSEPQLFGECARLARLTLSNLEINVEDNQNVAQTNLSLSTSSASVPAQLSPVEDMKSWLESVGLSEFDSLFSKHQLQFKDLVLLSEEDIKSLALPLGPERRLQNAILSLRRSQGLSTPLSPPKTESSSGSCLVCFDSAKDTVLVPCGHVATCEQCAQILRARKDRCVVCRTPVERIVKPFYV